MPDPSELPVPDENMWTAMLTSIMGSGSYDGGGEASQIEAVQSWLSIGCAAHYSWERAYQRAYERWHGYRPWLPTPVEMIEYVLAGPHTAA